jgi:ABC-type branched-subunit amino acid transport system substrate-binding protein
VAPQDFVNSGVYGGVPSGQGGSGGSNGTAQNSTNGATGGATSGQPSAVSTGGTGTGTPASGAPGGVAAQSNGGSAGTSSNLAAPASNCAGFRNGPGITSNQITIATIADVSGPVPNTFLPVEQAMTAFVDWFNSGSSICGRKLKLVFYDSGLSATGSADSSTAACSSAFALVGSLSAFDSGGANVTAGCGQPDIRATATEPARQHAPTTFEMVPIDSSHFGIEPWAWMQQKFPSAIKDAAFVYLNAGASITISQAIMNQTAAKLGYVWKKTVVVDIAGIPNWNEYANEFKSAGIKFVSSNLADFSPNLASAFKQAGYNPIYLADNSAYGQKYVTGANGQAMEGAYSYTQTAMMEEANRVPEMARYETWLQRIGGAAPSYAGAEAWAAGVLFVKMAEQLGGRLTRASLIGALRGVTSWTGNGIVDPGNPAQGSSAPCATMMRIINGRFVRQSPFPYTCGPLG